MSSWRSLLLRIGDKCPEYNSSDPKEHIVSTFLPIPPRSSSSRSASVLCKFSLPHVHMQLLHRLGALMSSRLLSNLVLVAHSARCLMGVSLHYLRLWICRKRASGHLGESSSIPRVKYWRWISAAILLLCHSWMRNWNLSSSSLQFLLQCAEQLPHKIPLYGTVVCYLWHCFRTSLPSSGWFLLDFLGL